jgi:hypothetical protein
MNIIVIILVTIVLILLYGLFVMYYYDKKSILVSSKLYLKNGSKSIPIDRSIVYKTFSYSLWVYLNTDIDSTISNIMYVSKNSSTTPSYTNGIIGKSSGVLLGVFSLYLQNNNLLITIGESSNNIMTPFTKQRWVNIFVNSFENTYYEVYINGKLIKTINAEGGVPTASSGGTFNIILGDNSTKDVVITKLVRFTKTLDSYSVWNNYLEGNGMSYNKYNASLLVKEDNKDLYYYKLFR